MFMIAPAGAVSARQFPAGWAEALDAEPIAPATG